MAGVLNSVEKIAPGIDVRSDGGHVVAPPSVIDGQAYAWGIEAPISRIPSWLQSDLTVDTVPAGDTMSFFSDEDLARWLALKREEEREKARAWAAKKYVATGD